MQELDAVQVTNKKLEHRKEVASQKQKLQHEKDAQKRKLQTETNLLQKEQRTEQNTNTHFTIQSSNSAQDTNIACDASTVGTTTQNNQ